MKKLSSLSVLGSFAATAAMLAGCSGSGPSSQVDPATALTVRDQSPGTAALSNGQKKVGQYVWVWRSKKLAVDQSAHVEAPCPTGYVVLGGGYKIATSKGYYGRPTASSRPSETFDGWVVDTEGGAYQKVTVTVYGACAPAK